MKAQEEDRFGMFGHGDWLGEQNNKKKAGKIC